jgi:hypothetical protein
MNASGSSEEFESAGAEELSGFTIENPPLVDLDALFEHNIQQINLMNVAAGSMVKGLIMELARGTRNTYIRLRDPVIRGHDVSYEFVSGNRDLVGRIGRALGFARVSDDRLEVRRG